MEGRKRSEDEGIDELVEYLLDEPRHRLTAPVRLPDNVEVRMVPLETVRDLDELRTSASSWFGAASVAWSVAIGILVNWLTAETWSPALAASIALAVALTVAAMASTVGLRASLRARRKRRQLFGDDSNR